MSETLEVPRSPSSLLGGYAPPRNTFDEVFSSDGKIRPAWKRLVGALDALGPAELTRRWERAQEEVHENGVTYHAYDEARERPWELDALPLLLDAAEWQSLVGGLVQRAKLLNRVLADLYGPQELLQSGLLPAEWLFGHPGFRRRFHGHQPAERPYLQIYAADLARGADGRWWVVNDRTDAPVGLGYALENRIATSRMIPEIFRECHIERLAHFFICLQKALRGLAAEHRENPRIVLLSHGPGGPNYFEDAFLARYLGYTLVDGGDLAVRDDHVFLKTLSGLLPVDVIFRRLSDEFCDPLEVRSGSQLGVPGLLQAVRLGNCAIANSFGASLVESPGLMPFLPGIAKRWLSEELRIPAVPSWWCGQAAERDQVTRQIDRFAFRPAYRVARRELLDPDDLQRADSQALRPLIESRATEIVAHEPIVRSTAPVWSNRSADSRFVALRVFLVAHQGSYQALPGGLVRVGKESRLMDGSVLAGEISKDAWVLATGPVRQVSLLSTSKEPITLRRSGAEVPSRVADHLFWFGRRVERAQGACRLLRPVVDSLMSEDSAEGPPELPTLIRALAAHGQIEPGFSLEAMKEVMPTIAQALPAAVLDEHQAGGLRSTFEQAYLNAALVRDRLSLDSWRIVHRIQRTFRRVTDQHAEIVAVTANGEGDDVPARSFEGFGLVDLAELLDDLIVDFAAMDGLFSESMTRTPAWRFLELGRRLERSLYMIALTQSLLATSVPTEGKAIEAVLMVADSLMTYRGRYLAAVHLATALDLLLTDETNPRSLAFQLVAIADHVANLPSGTAPPLGTPEHRISSSLVHAIRMLDVEDLCAKRSDSEVSKLERALLRIADQLPKLSDLVSHRYLIHAGQPRQLSDARRESR